MEERQFYCIGGVNPMDGRGRISPGADRGIAKAQKAFVSRLVRARI